MTHSLTLGSLLLTDDLPEADHGYVFSVLAEGASFGVAQGVQEVVRSLLADGDLVRITRSGNREVTFAVEITGPSLASLAQGEAALRREVGRPNSLAWQAPDMFAVPTVFEVLASEMSQTFDDLDELRKRRKYTITLTCSPFARSAEETTIAAFPQPSSTSTTTIDTCDSATGWSGTVNGVTVAPDMGWSPGAVSVHELLNPSAQTLTLTRSGSVNFSSTRYLVVEIGWMNAEVAPHLIDASSGGSVIPRVTQRLIEPGWFSCVYDTGGANLSSLTFSATFSGAYGDLKVRNVARTAVPPGASSRQLSRIFEVGGTERTPCSLKVVPAAAEALGVALVHTSPEAGVGYDPSLRQRRFSGNPVTNEAGTFSGKKEAVTGTPIVAQVPLTSLPEDGYALMAMMRSSVVGTYSFTWQARTIVDGVYLGGYEGTAQARFFDANVWTLVPISIVTLPPVRATQNGYVQFNITRTVVDEEIYLDEWWAFRVGTDCALTIVQDNDSSFLWLDSPDVSSPVPRVWVSNNSDRSDQRHPGIAGLIAQGNHVLHPEGTSVFVASTGIEYPGLAATYFKRWHSNAAE